MSGGQFIIHVILAGLLAQMLPPYCQQYLHTIKHEWTIKIIGPSWPIDAQHV